MATRCSLRLLSSSLIFLTLSTCSNALVSRTRKEFGARQPIAQATPPLLQFNGSSDTFASFGDKAVPLESSSDGQPRWLYDNIFRHTMGMPNKKPAEHIFVEYGARDGLQLSNTLLFEKGFGWHGLLVEGLSHYQVDLNANRDCTLPGATEKSCVRTLLDNSSGKTLYYGQGDAEQALDQKGAADADSLSTSTLDSLLARFNIKSIDLLVADCQGCELRSLQGLNLDTVDVSVIMVEINSDFCQIKEMLAARGFVGIHINNCYDVAFLSKHIVEALANAPQPSTRTGGRNREVNEWCGDHMWSFGQPWPPTFE